MQIYPRGINLKYKIIRNSTSHCYVASDVTWNTILTFIRWSLAFLISQFVLTWPLPTVEKIKKHYVAYVCCMRCPQKILHVFLHVNVNDIVYVDIIEEFYISSDVLIDIKKKHGFKIRILCAKNIARDITCFAKTWQET